MEFEINSYKWTKNLSIQEDNLSRNSRKFIGYSLHYTIEKIMGWTRNCRPLSTCFVDLLACWRFWLNFNTGLCFAIYDRPKWIIRTYSRLDITDEPTNEVFALLVQDEQLCLIGMFISSSTRIVPIAMASDANAATKQN